MATIGVIGTHAYVAVAASGITWTAANAAATATGGHLVTLTSAAEDSFVGTIQAANTTGDYWIGLSDAAVEGTFAWVTGEAVTFTDWNPGEPNNQGDEDYVTGNFLGAGHWNDEFDANRVGVGGYVVEFDSAGAFRSASNPFRDTGDTFQGSDGADRILGRGGADTLVGAGGDDSLTGGGGDDLFVVAVTDAAGRDVLTDFDAAGNDVIQLVGFGLDFAGVTAAASERGSSVLIALDAEHSLVLRGTTLASLTADDFVFG